MQDTEAAPATEVTSPAEENVESELVKEEGEQQQQEEEMEAIEWTEPESSAKPKHQESMIALKTIINFVFPKELQHPQSTGRLFALGLYGPLNGKGELRSGARGEHVLQGWELDSMGQSFEREDIIQSYVPFGRAVSTLSHEEMQEIIFQADSSLKRAKGKAWMPQITKAELKELLSGLRKDAAHRYSFNEVQRVIMKYRVDRIARNKLVFPRLPERRRRPLTSSKENTATNQPAPAPSASSSGKCKAVSRPHVPHAGRFRVSESVAPAVMFLKDQGLNDTDVPRITNRLLSSKAFAIASLSEANCPGLTMNVRLLRDTDKRRPSRGTQLDHGASILTSPSASTREWDGLSGIKGAGRGSMVKCARSATAGLSGATVL